MADAVLESELRIDGKIHVRIIRTEMIIPAVERASRPLAAEHSDNVRRCARAFERSRIIGDPGYGTRGESTMREMERRGLVYRGGSGAGRGLEIDADVAQAMGLYDFDYS